MRAAVLALAFVLAAPSAGVAAKTHRKTPAPNTGAKGSPCKARYMPGAPDPSLDMTSLGVLPAAYEVGAPASGPVKRVMLVIHGGGWFQVGQGMLNTEHDNVQQWRKAGWQTVNTTYRACRRSFDDVLTTYDAVRAHVGPQIPICIKGDSAGGQLALMIAARRSDVACVIAGGAPTDLWTIKPQGVTAGLGAQAGTVRGLALAAFGRKRLVELSPASNVAAIRARVLLVQAQNDMLVPPQQQQQMADMLAAANPGADVQIDVVAPGDKPFLHGLVSALGLDALQRRTAEFVRPYLPKESLLQRLLKLLPFN